MLTTACVVDTSDHSHLQMRKLKGRKSRILHRRWVKASQAEETACDRPGGWKAQWGRLKLGWEPWQAWELGSGTWEQGSGIWEQGSGT